MGKTIVSVNKPSPVTLHKIMQLYSINQKCLNHMPNIDSKSQYAKNQVVWCREAHIKHFYKF